MTDREAMKLALEALETLPAGSSYKTHNAASALRQVLQKEKTMPITDDHGQAIQPQYNLCWRCALEKLVELGGSKVVEKPNE